MKKRTSVIIAFCFCSIVMNAQKKSFAYLPTPQLTSLDRVPITQNSDTLQSSVMLQNFNYQKVYDKSLGFFCRAEDKASKKAGIQLRMRLGSLEYVDRMEGKIK